MKCDGTSAETRFPLSAKRSSPFKSEGATGSRSVRFNGSNAGYIMFRGGVKGTGYPLHSPVSPSIPLPCVTVCHHISTGLYHHTETSSVIRQTRIKQEEFFLLTPPMKMEQTECSETSSHKIQTPDNHPKARIQHSEHGESLKSSIKAGLYSAQIGSRLQVDRRIRGWLRPEKKNWKIKVINGS